MSEKDKETKERFLPGPWSVELRNGKQMYVRKLRGEHGEWLDRLVCQKTRSVKRHGAVDDANFALIAAAPDMYDLLARILSEITRDELPVRDRARTYLAIEAVLAKARGEKK